MESTTARNSPKGTTDLASQTLELVDSDVCAQIEAKSLSGKEYFVTLIDDKSRFMWSYALKYNKQRLMWTSEIKAQRSKGVQWVNKNVKCSSVQRCAMSY